MAVYADGTTYNYYRAYKIKSPINIGWLDRNVPFPTGASREGTCQRLIDHVPFRMNSSRGGHGCTLCARGQRITEFATFGISMCTAEIWVASSKGIVFACPDLIIHYVNTHHYQPPKDFMKALFDGPTPGSDEWSKIIRSIE